LATAIVLGLGILGIIRLVQYQGWFAAATHPTVVLWAYFTAIHAFIVSQDRYNFPSVPMIVILGGFAVACWLDAKQLVPQGPELK
jgi:hypothetical protein